MRRPKTARGSGAGFSLIELLVAIVVIALVVGVAAGIGGPLLVRERVRSNVYLVQAAMQRTRAEAVSRNRECRLMINAGDGRMFIVDRMGSTTTTDDVVVWRGSLAESSAFVSPDGTLPLTITKFVGNWHRVDFAGDGTVATGSGQVVLGAGSSYGRVSAYVGGGTQVAFWDGSRWYETGL